MKRLGITLSAILLLSTAAQAADLSWNSGSNSSSIYSPTSASDWSGFYAGVSAGYGWGTLSRRAVNGGPTTENNTGGAAVGVTGGYNIDMGGFVVGAEADLQWSNIGYSTTLGNGDKLTAGIDAFGTVRGRAGMSFGQVMPFVTAGFAAGRGSVTLDNNVTTSQSATHLGWTIGAGLEAKATDNISIKAEYLYVDLGTQAYNNLPAPIGSIDATQRFSVIRAGLNYKF